MIKSLIELKTITNFLINTLIKARRLMRDRYLKFRDEYPKLTYLQRWYANALFTFGLYLTVNFFHAEFAQTIFYIALIIWLCAICVDTAAIFQNIYETTLGKLVILVSFTLVTNFAIGLAGQTINDIVGVEPAKFSLTIALISILITPALLSIILAIGFIVVVVLSLPIIFLHLIDSKAIPIIFPGYKPNSDFENYPRLTNTVRTLSFVSILGLCFLYIQDKESTHKYESFVKDAAISFLYEFEMYSKLPCNFESDAKAVFLNIDTILVAKKDGDSISFNQRECKPVSQAITN